MTDDRVFTTAEGPQFFHDPRRKGLRDEVWDCYSTAMHGAMCATAKTEDLKSLPMSVWVAVAAEVEPCVCGVLDAILPTLHLILDTPPPVPVSTEDPDSPPDASDQIHMMSQDLERARNKARLDHNSRGGLPYHMSPARADILRIAEILVDAGWRRG